jgi:hypothetical protein
MTNAYLNRMPAGIPGEVTRQGSAVLETRLLGAASIAFGAPVKISGTTLAPVAAGDTPDLIYGFLARSYPTTGIGDGPAAAPAGSLQSVMRRGYMSVALKGSAPAALAGQVYVRVTAADGKAVGDIEAAGGAGLVAVPGGIFMGAADAGGSTEISLLMSPAVNITINQE